VYTVLTKGLETHIGPFEVKIPKLRIYDS